MAERARRLQKGAEPWTRCSTDSADPRLRTSTARGGSDNCVREDVGPGSRRANAELSLGDYMLATAISSPLSGLAAATGINVSNP